VEPSKMPPCVKALFSAFMKTDTRLRATTTTFRLSLLLFFSFLVSFSVTGGTTVFQILISPLRSRTSRPSPLASCFSRRGPLSPLFVPRPVDDNGAKTWTPSPLTSSRDCPPAQVIVFYPLVYPSPPRDLAEVRQSSFRLLSILYK